VSSLVVVGDSLLRAPGPVNTTPARASSSRATNGRALALELKAATPADPPTFRTAVPNWRAGDVIPLGGLSLRVVEVRDDDADQAPTLIVAAPRNELPANAVQQGAGREAGYFGEMNRLIVTSPPLLPTFDVLCPESGSTDESLCVYSPFVVCCERMTRLGVADYEAVLSFLEEAQTLDGLAPITPELLDRLAQLADCEWATFFEIDHTPNPHRLHPLRCRGGNALADRGRMVDVQADR
jgi:hypothetical protein